MTNSFQEHLAQQEFEREVREADRALAQQQQADQMEQLTPSLVEEQGPDFIPGASEAATAQLEAAQVEPQPQNQSFLGNIIDTKQESLDTKISVLQGVGDTAVGLLGMAEKAALHGQSGVVDQYIKPFWDKHNPQSDNGVHHSIRQISGVVLPSILIPQTVIPRVAALPFATKVPGAVRTLGNVAARIGIDTAVVAGSTTARDDNAAKALNDAFGWNIPWATREGAGEDEKFKAQLYENMGFGAAGELLTGALAVRSWMKARPTKNQFAAPWIHKHDVKRYQVQQVGEVAPGTQVEWDPGLVLKPKTPEAAEQLVKSADNITKQTTDPELLEIENLLTKLEADTNKALAEATFDEDLLVISKQFDESIDALEARKLKRLQEIDNLDPLTRHLKEVDSARTQAVAEEAAEKAKVNQGEYDPILDPIHEDQAIAQSIVGPADPLGAGYDYHKMLNDLNTAKGRARAVMPTSGMRKLFNAPEGSVRHELLQNLTEAAGAHKGVDALIEGKWKASPEDWKNAVDIKVAEIHKLAPDELKKTVNALKTNALRGADFLPTEEFLLYSQAARKVMEGIMPDQIRASAMVVQQAADSASSAAKAGEVLSEVLETSRQTENMLTNLGIVMKETRAVRSLWGYTGQLLDMTKGNRFDAKKMWEVVSEFDKNLARAHKESMEFVDEWKRVAIEEPELFEALRRAYDLTDGRVSDVSKLNRWAERSVGFIGKLVYDKSPETKSLVVQGINGVRYNSLLNGLAPVRAALGNAMLTINKPVSIFAGSAFQAATGDFTSANAIFKRALFTYGGVVENFQRALRHMHKEWDFVISNPEQAMLRGRNDIKFASSDQLEVVELASEMWRRSGDYGHLAMLKLAQVTSWYNNLSLNRWGLNALHSIDGFTNSMMASGSARTKAYDQLFQETGGVIDGTFQMRFQKLQNEIYNEAFDATGLLKDEAAKHASREIALNLDSETAKRMENIIELYPVLKPLFMFPRTGINGLKVAWSYNPLSALPDAIGKGNQVFKASNESEILDVLRTHGITDFSDPMTALQTLKNEYRGRQMMGSAVVMGAGLMAVNGDLTGNGPHDAAEKKDMMRLGWKPLSIRLNGEWYSYKGFEPFQQILGLVGDITYNANRVDSSLTEDWYLKLGYALSMNVTNQTFLSGMAPLVGILSRDETSINRFIAQSIDPVTVGAVPGLWSGTRSVLNKAISPQLKDVENDFKGYMMNNSKFLFNTNDDLKDQLDVYTGKRINYTDQPTAAINAFLPYFKSNGGDEPWRQWLLKTGWNGLNTLRVNRYTRQPLDADERYFINTWVAKYGGLREQIKHLMAEDMRGKYTKKYVDSRGKKKQKQFPIKNSYIHDQLDKMHDTAFRNAWLALEQENDTYGQVGLLEKYKQQQMEYADYTGASDTQREIEGLLENRQPLN